MERVAALFYGYPSLVWGFNTFLPHGYRMECVDDTDNPGLITITTPMGTTTQAIRGVCPPGSILMDRELAASRYRPPPPPLPVHPLSSYGEIDIELALAYVQKVKTRYANDPDRYKAFLEIMSPSREDGVDVASDDVCPQHISLFYGCLTFLSPGSYERRCRTTRVTVVLGRS